eukprot:4211999-Karenia_brevis.AAC.1
MPSRAVAQCQTPNVNSGRIPAGNNSQSINELPWRMAGTGQPKPRHEQSRPLNGTHILSGTVV